MYHGGRNHACTMEEGTMHVPWRKEPCMYQIIQSILISEDKRKNYEHLQIKYRLKNWDCLFTFFSGLKGTVSSRSEQTFNRAWNRCPSLRWTLLIAAAAVYDLIMVLARNLPESTKIQHHAWAIQYWAHQNPAPCMGYTVLSPSKSNTMHGLLLSPSICNTTSCWSLMGMGFNSK